MWAGAAAKDDARQALKKYDNPLGLPDAIAGGVNKFNDVMHSFGEYALGGGVASRAGDAVRAAIDPEKDYDQIRVETLKEQEREKDRTPVGTFVGGIGGSTVDPIGKLLPIVKGAKGVANAAARIGINVADSATRSESFQEAIDNAETAGKVSLLFEGAPYLKRLIPGTKGAYHWVNASTAKVAEMIPGQSASSDEIYEYLSKPEMRRKVKNTDLLDETNKLLPEVDDAANQLNEAVGKSYGKKEDLFVNQDTAELSVKQLTNNEKDRALANEFKDTFVAKLKAMEENSALYEAPARKVAAKVTHMLQKGGVDDIAGDMTQQPLTINAIKGRFIEARRELDDVIKNKNFENFGRDDKRFITSLRDELNEKLQKEFSGSENLREADKLYNGYKKNVSGFVDRLTKKGSDGVDLTKTFNDLKSGSARGKSFDLELDKIEKWISDNAENLDEAAIDASHKALSEMRRLRDLGALSRLEESLKRSGGGPTSQAINTAGQVLGAMHTGGASLLALPVTNPYAWAKFLDAIPEGSARALEAANKRGANALAVTHMLLMKKDPEYRQAIENTPE
jgi:hypothetical protein